MPTPLSPPEGRPLSWRAAGVALVLLLRAGLARRQMERVGTRLDAAPRAADGEALTACARRWLDAHAQLAALFGVPEPPSVAEVRAILDRAPAAHPSRVDP